MNKYQTQRKKILDYGCGLGGNSPWLSRRGEYVGIDILEENIEYANKRYDSTQFILSEGVKIPFSDGYFDEIHSYDVLEHVLDFDSVIQEFVRVAKQEGKIFIVVPAEKSEKLFAKLKPKYNQEIGHVRIVDYKALIGFFENNGFVLEKLHKVRGMEALVLAGLFWKKNEKEVVSFQTGSPKFSKWLVAFMWLFDTRLFTTQLKYFFPIYICTLPLGWLISRFFPKSMYIVVRKKNVL